jgi:hypothetical protein
MRRLDVERVDRWIGRVVGGVFAVKVVLAVVFVAVSLLGFADQPVTGCPPHEVGPAQSGAGPLRVRATTLGL